MIQAIKNNNFSQQQQQQPESDENEWMNKSETMDGFISMSCV